MVEMFNIGEWFTHGGNACDVNVDIIGVVEHRLIPAKVRHEWSRLHVDGIHSVWSPASRKHCQVGQAGVGVVSLKGAPVSLPIFATSQREGLLGRFCRKGRGGLHLVGTFGYQGASHDPEAPAETRLLFDAVLGEHAAAAGCQPRPIIGNFSVEPNPIPGLQKRDSK